MNSNPYQSRDVRGRKLPASHCWRGHPLEGDNIYYYNRTGVGQVRACRECRRINDRKNGQNRRKAFRQKYFDILKSSKCVDCGESRPETLHFDHIDPSQKAFTISNALSKKKHWPEVEEEIAKCEVRCANCHAIRTAEQFGWYKDLN